MQNALQTSLPVEAGAAAQTHVWCRGCEFHPADDRNRGVRKIRTVNISQLVLLSNSNEKLQS